MSGEWTSLLSLCDGGVKAALAHTVARTPAHPQTSRTQGTQVVKVEREVNEILLTFTARIMTSEKSSRYPSHPQRLTDRRLEIRRPVFISKLNSKHFHLYNSALALHGSLLIFITVITI